MPDDPKQQLVSLSQKQWGWWIDRGVALAGLAFLLGIGIPWLRDAQNASNYSTQEMIKDVAKTIEDKHAEQQRIEEQQRVEATKAQLEAFTEVVKLNTAEKAEIRKDFRDILQTVVKKVPESLPTAPAPDEPDNP